MICPKQNLKFSALTILIAVTPKAKFIFHPGGFITKIKVINLDIFRMLLSIHHFDTLQ